jgi:DNA-binding NarL/FixJ family response regulator
LQSPGSGIDAVCMQRTATPTRITRRPLRLLVVDDDAGVRALLEVTSGLDPRYELVDVASTAAEAMRSLQRHGRDASDVVLLDVTLPDRCGIDLVGEIRASGGRPAVVLHTGWSDRETLERARASGADAVLGKDGDPQLLLDRIHRLLLA